MKKHILIGLCVVSVIVLIIQITYTYSLFETDRDAVVVSPIAKWNVLVNNINVTYNLSQQNSFVLGGVNWQSGNHVRAGKAAPGSVGTFEINVDPTDTEVSFLYEITIDTSGMLAICLQHEIDHLSGILYYDHINKEDPMFAKPE